jgi:hypothetical protein
VGDLFPPRFCLALQALGDQVDSFGEIDAGGKAAGGPTWSRSAGQLKATLEAGGTTVVEDAGHYGDSESIRIDALKRADGEPATDQDASAVLISTDGASTPPSPWSPAGRNSASSRSTNATTAEPRPGKDRWPRNRRPNGKP